MKKVSSLGFASGSQLGKGLPFWGNFILREVLVQVPCAAAHSILEKSGPSHDHRAALAALVLGGLLLFAVVPKLVHIHRWLQHVTWWQCMGSR